MPPRKTQANSPDRAVVRAARANSLADPAPIAGVPGPGRWLLAELAPVSLFSLKTSQATSGVGRTLVVPTPYAIKMACVDAAFRVGWPDSDCAELLDTLVGVEVRIRPPGAAVVTHTIVKIRQEPKKPSPEQPYLSSVAYREVVYHAGRWLWAFDLAGGDDLLAGRLVTALPHVRSIGKRGSFVQFLGFQRADDLGEGFTAPIVTGDDFRIGAAWHVQQLDDFGPEATFARLSTFSAERARRDRDRTFTTTIIPLGLVRSGPGFSEYRDRP
ncbi:MAG: hypothetical protein IT306_04650 [Chloroflexi bacterium]|nr:hypothetical protein [Chloroflexota bacterium]